VLLASLAALTAAACATLPPCPAQGGPAWQELTSDHFVVRTDLDAADGQEVVRRLEETRAAMLVAVWPEAPGPPDRSAVIALRYPAELSEFLGYEIAGEYVVARPFPKTMIIAGTAEADDGNGLLTLRHELAHHLSRWFLTLQTPWYAEGMASFLETIQYDRGQGQAVIGEASLRRLQLLGRASVMSIKHLIASTSVDADDLALFEASSWLLVHYLVNHKNAAFEEFQRRMGRFEPPDKAWAGAFPDVNLDRLQLDLDEYARSGQYRVAHLPVAPWRGTTTARTLSDAEVHGLRAFMYVAVRPPGEGPMLERARAEVAEALREDPGQPEAAAVRYYTRDSSSGAARAAPAPTADVVELARRTTTAHPESWMAWVMAADAAGVNATARQDALTRALAAAPNEPEVLLRLALLRASQDRWPEALPFSSKAIRLGVVDGNLLLAHTIALAQIGSCEQAAYFAAGAKAQLPPARVQALAATWEKLRTVCAQVASKRAAESAGDDDARSGDR
jgi:hypothetical protein